MRLILTICLLWLLQGIGLAQSSQPDPFTVRPDAAVTVRKHPMGADIVEITLLDPKYPEKVLREQIDRLGRDLRCTPRGVSLTSYTTRAGDPDSVFVKANFAVDGLTEPNTGVFRLGPIARALAGGPAGHEIKGIMVTFPGLTPGASTLRSFGMESNAPVSVQGHYAAGPIGLEYRIALHTQDPRQINIPDTANAVHPATVPAATKKSDTPWLLYAAICLGAVGVGALVYSLTLRGAATHSAKNPRYPHSGSSRH